MPKVYTYWEKDTKGIQIGRLSIMRYTPVVWEFDYHLYCPCCIIWLWCCGFEVMLMQKGGGKGDQGL